MKRKSSSRKRTKEDENGTSSMDENGQDEQLLEKKRKRSKSRRSKSRNDSEQSEEESENGAQDSNDADPLGEDGEDAEYEVEAILDEKMIRGVRHFLIRWKGYTDESDTWEPEKTLDCADLIKEYTKRQKKEAKKKKSKKSGDSSATWDENEDFEVGRILDVYFHKDGKRDFLVSWKGYPPAQNSWEPEENMDCKDLINKFMLKVEAAKQFEGKETKLRTSRKPVERLEFSMHEHSRRLSKRYRGKERVHYFDAE
ncbi:chromobox protein homolog 1-like [Sitophilus oryzae]|uniref:Chromobox protein homolog 1-like n=1 Tax=Sitophilus oryzae TaxID=7048 RepID=A0A6J2YQK7_SITOR|nr:chromobox protein homolog 1-like [Sitophilus oryzae]